MSEKKEKIYSTLSLIYFSVLQTFACGRCIIAKHGEDEMMLEQQEETVEGVHEEKQ